MTVLLDSGYNIDASFLFSGMGDYWGGDGDRWDDNAGCLFAYYGPDTTLRQIVDGWLDDYEMGGDCDTFPGDIDSEDIREALLDMLSKEGKADYESGALSEFALAYASANDIEPGEEPEDDFGESPVAIVLIKVAKA